MAKEHDTYIPRDEAIGLNKDFDKIIEQAREELMKIPGVIAVGIGLKEKKGQTLRVPCIKVAVQKKKGKKEVSQKELIPPSFYGYETDVDETDVIAPCEDSRKYRPLIGGSQIGCSTDTGIGTLGCFAKRDADDKIVLLSNWHVIVGGVAINGDRVGQPGHMGCCACCTCNEIGVVVDGSLQGNNMDAAIALLHGQDGGGDTLPDHRYVNEIIGVGHVAGSAAPVVFETVWKRGRTSEWTEGQIISNAFPNSIEYESYGNLIIARISHRVQPVAGTPRFADPGDSGSVIVNEHNQAVLLLFGKRIIDHHGIATNIQNVEAQLNITILDSTFHDGELDQLGASASGVPLSSTSASAPVSASNLERALEDVDEKIMQYAEGRRLKELFETHREEVLHLVNHHRETMVAWNRYQGPEYMARIIQSIRRDKPLPDQIKGVSLHNLLLKMTAVLQRNGSPKLSEAVSKDYLSVITLLQGQKPADWFNNLDKMEKELV